MTPVRKTAAIDHLAGRTRPGLRIRPSMLANRRQPEVRCRVRRIRVPAGARLFSCGTDADLLDEVTWRRASSWRVGYTLRMKTATPGYACLSACHQQLFRT
jgi:hypothetical protein